MKLQFKFLVPVFLLFGTFFVLFFYSEQQHSQRSLEQTILSQARSLDHLIRATRLVYHSEFLASDFSVNHQTQVFLPSHTMSKISAKLTELSSDNTARFRSINTTPYSTIHKATALELQALDSFAEHPEQKECFESFEQNGELFYHYSTPTYFLAYCLECHPESTAQPGELNGLLSITVSAEQLKVQTMQRQSDNLLILLASLFTCWLVTLWLYRKVIRTKLDLLHTISKRNMSGNYTTDVDVTGNDELDQLISSMNQMSGVIADREAELLKAHEFSSAVLSNISDAVSVIDADNATIVAANRAFLDMHGVSYSETIGQPCHRITQCRNVINEGDDETPQCPGQIAIAQNSAYRAERVRQVEERKLFFDVSASPICDAEGKVVQVVRVARNITENKQQEEQIRKLAYYDGLTGLPNRTLFHDRLRQSLLLSEREKSSGVIAFLDLDLFKEVNDSLGHAAGDTLLRIIAKRLSACVRESDTVARLGGDEFLIILHEMHEPRHAEIMAEQLLEAIHKPITIHGTEVQTSASIGMCFYPHSGSNVDDLLKCADGAMYEAKRSGRNTYHISGCCRSAKN